MAILRYIITSCLTLAMTACFEDFDPKIDVKPVLCINSLIEAGEPIVVTVSRSFLYTETDYDNIYVKDAVVTIFANGERVSPDYLPKQGDVIRIEASSDEYGSAEAEVKVPYAVTVRSVKLTPTVQRKWLQGDGTMQGGVDFNVEIAVEIADDPAEDNYFKFDYQSFSPEGETIYEYDDEGNIVWVQAANAWFMSGLFQNENEPILGEHIGALDAVMGGDSYGFTFFTDRQFAGRTYTLHLFFTDCRYEVASKKWHDGLLDCGYDITLSAISKSYYDWANYRWQAEEGVIGGLGEAGLADQLWGYSNVSTNAGVVAAQSSVKFRVNLSDFLSDIIAGKE